MKKGLTMQELEQLEKGLIMVYYNGKIYNCEKVYTGGMVLQAAYHNERITVSAAEIYCNGKACE